MTNKNGCCYHISDGNRKLKPDEGTAFLIWNLPSVKTCPYRTALCEKFCYARKSERAYPAVLPAREDNLQASLQGSFVEDMTEFILKKAKRQKKERLVVRIHESGDFYNKAYAEKWLAIAKACTVNPKIQFIAYTKSFVYFDGVELPSNFALRASIWSDTERKQLDIVFRNDWCIYTAVEHFTEQDSFHQCRCTDCASCAKCWDPSVKDIRCEIH